MRVASFDFTESEVLAELYAQGLERAGIPVVRQHAVGAREEVEPALEQGVVELVPEYAGAALTFLSPGPSPATSDPETTYQRLRVAFAARGLTTLARAPAQDQNAVAVTRDLAGRLNLRLVSDLRPVASGLTFGGPPECPVRRACLKGLTETYGLTFRAFRPLDAAGPLTIAALQGGDADVVVLFTTTPQVDTVGFVLLADDRGLQPAENVVPVVRNAVVERYGDRLSNALDPISARLTSEELRRLNTAVEVDRRSPAVVVRDWLRQHQTAA